MAGTRVVPRNLKQQHIWKVYEEKVCKQYYETVVKLDLQLYTKTLPQILNEKQTIAALTEAQNTGLFSSD